MTTPKAATDELHQAYAYARASWALATGQDWRSYDDLTETDLDAWRDVLANRKS